MDEQREQERRTYTICRIGFMLLAFSLMIAAASTLLFIPKVLPIRGLAPKILDHPIWEWSDTPVVWGSLIGVYLLWGRWPGVGWQRRSGLLLLMCIADAVLWSLDHSESLGLRMSEFGHHWLRSQIGQALGWAEFALIASLTCDVLTHLGVERAGDASRASRSMAATGALIWLLVLIQMTNWHTWPLERKMPNLETYLLFLGSHMIWTVILVQVTALSIAAVRQCSTVLREIDAQERDHDLLRLPSEHAQVNAIDHWNDDNPYRAPKGR